MDSKPVGHEDAMRDLAQSMIDSDADFDTWNKKFETKQKVVTQPESPRKLEPPRKHRVRGRKLAVRNDQIEQPEQLQEIIPRMEIFAPPPGLEAEAKRRGLKFTIGKKYPIHAELLEVNPKAGMRYITTDDEGNRRSVNAIHFVPDVQLVWHDVVDNAMIDHRVSKKGWSIEKIGPDTFTLNI